MSKLITSLIKLVCLSFSATYILVYHLQARPDCEGGLQALPTNIRLGRKSLAVTNTLAYKPHRLNNIAKILFSKDHYHEPVSLKLFNNK